MNQIVKTKDYSLFKRLNYNRDVCKNHVKKLVWSIQSQNDLHLFPIIVNDQFEIVDGQHRLEAAKELGFDVYYIVDSNYKIEKITTFNNNQKRWVIEDHLKKFSAIGNENYIQLTELLKDVGFTLHTCLIWLAETSDRMILNFRNGHFKFDLDEKKFDAIFKAKKIISVLKKNNFKPISIYNQTFFHTALKKIITNEFVDFDSFYKNFSANPHLARFCRSSYEYAEMFCDIYNHHRKIDRLKTQKDKKDYDFVV